MEKVRLCGPRGGVQGRARVDTAEAERQRNVALSQRKVRDYVEKRGLTAWVAKVSGTAKTAQFVEWLRRQLGVDVVDTKTGEAKVLSTVTEPFVLAAGQGSRARQTAEGGGGPPARFANARKFWVWMIENGVLEVR